MNKYIRINGKNKWFDLARDKQTAVFGPCGEILASCIHRMNKGRYKVYIIWTGGLIDTTFQGMGSAMDWLQEQYNAVQ